MSRSRPVGERRQEQVDTKTYLEHPSRVIRTEGIERLRHGCAQCWRVTINAELDAPEASNLREGWHLGRAIHCRSSPDRIVEKGLDTLLGLGSNLLFGPLGRGLLDLARAWILAMEFPSRLVFDEQFDDRFERGLKLILRGIEAGLPAS